MHCTGTLPDIILTTMAMHKVKCFFQSHRLRLHRNFYGAGVIITTRWPGNSLYNKIIKSSHSRGALERIWSPSRSAVRFKPDPG